MAFKGQPWIVYDSIVARSFLLGDETNGIAVGGRTPALNAAGEGVFFSAGRTRANVPWYCNLDLDGQLPYGFEAWQMYFSLEFPIVTPNQNNGYDLDANAGVPPTVKLAEAIIHFGVMELVLGQEEQTFWPLSRYGAGGGIHVSNNVVTCYVQNSLPNSDNEMKLPEAVEMIRTQNVNAKLRIAPQALPLIGTPAAPGVGSPLDPYVYAVDVETSYDLPQNPFKMQFGLKGRRVKDVQYGQLPPGRQG